MAVKVSLTIIFFQWELLNVNFPGDPQRSEDLPSEEEDGEGEKGEDGGRQDF